MTPTQKAIQEVGAEITSMLLAKNQSYGNSALDPVRIFSKADAGEQLLVRIDDKLSRIMRGNGFPGDNDLLDLVGYLHLEMVRRKMAQEDAEKPDPESFAHSLMNCKLCGEFRGHGHDCEPKQPVKKCTYSTDDGWVAWEGGECPVADSAIVHFKLRREMPSVGPITEPKIAGCLDWANSGCSSDIIAYKLA